MHRSLNPIQQHQLIQELGHKRNWRRHEDPSTKSAAHPKRLSPIMLGDYLKTKPACCYCVWRICPISGIHKIIHSIDLAQGVYDLGVVSITTIILARELQKMRQTSSTNIT
eukprot:TRINITY_DN6399_c0_g1_i1.p1 TRINITY_DN6399_c0_g1~~TRINITY_DN6399_c0_g1_i1.p1  ORF type:complete len:111 (+),score=10.40 TRINITY_DN6399_c0_g1_i1:122-454(+)